MKHHKTLHKIISSAPSFTEEITVNVKDLIRFIKGENLVAAIALLRPLTDISNLMNNSKTLLHYVAQYCKKDSAYAQGDFEEFMNLLMEKSSDCLFQHDLTGKTPAHIAAEFNNNTVLEIFANHNNDCLLTSSVGKVTQTPIHTAASLGHNECLQIAKDKLNNFDTQGIDVRNSFDMTPLYYAANKGHLETVTWLLVNCSPNTNAKNLNGKTALHAAMMGGHPEVAKLLLENGARVMPDNERKLPSDRTKEGSEAPEALTNAEAELLKRPAGVPDQLNHKKAKVTVSSNRLTVPAFPKSPGAAYSPAKSEGSSAPTGSPAPSMASEAESPSRKGTKKETKKGISTTYANVSFDKLMRLPFTEQVEITSKIKDKDIQSAVARRILEIHMDEVVTPEVLANSPSTEVLELLQTHLFTLIKSAQFFNKQEQDSLSTLEPIGFNTVTGCIVKREFTGVTYHNAMEVDPLLGTILDCVKNNSLSETLLVSALFDISSENIDRFTTITKTLIERDQQALEGQQAPKTRIQEAGKTIINANRTNNALASARSEGAVSHYPTVEKDATLCTSMEAVYLELFRDIGKVILGDNYDPQTDIGNDFSFNWDKIQPHLSNGKTKDDLGKLEKKQKLEDVNSAEEGIRAIAAYLKNDLKLLNPDLPLDKLIAQLKEIKITGTDLVTKAEDTTSETRELLPHPQYWLVGDVAFPADPPSRLTLANNLIGSKKIKFENPIADASPTSSPSQSPKQAATSSPLNKQKPKLKTAITYKEFKELSPENRIKALVALSLKDRKIMLHAIRPRLFDGVNRRYLPGQKEIETLFTTFTQNTTWMRSALKTEGIGRVSPDDKSYKNNFTTGLKKNRTLKSAEYILNDTSFEVSDTHEYFSYFKALLKEANLILPFDQAELFELYSFVLAEKFKVAKEAKKAESTYVKNPQPEIEFNQKVKELMENNPTLATALRFFAILGANPTVTKMNNSNFSTALAPNLFQTLLNSETDPIKVGAYTKTAIDITNALLDAIEITPEESAALIDECITDSLDNTLDALMNLDMFWEASARVPELLVDGDHTNEDADIATARTAVRTVMDQIQARTGTFLTEEANTDLEELKLTPETFSANAYRISHILGKHNTAEANVNLDKITTFFARLADQDGATNRKTITQFAELLAPYLLPGLDNDLAIGIIERLIRERQADQPFAEGKDLRDGPRSPKEYLLRDQERETNPQAKFRKLVRGLMFSRAMKAQLENAYATNAGSLPNLNRYADICANEEELNLSILRSIHRRITKKKDGNDKDLTTLWSDIIQWFKDNDMKETVKDTEETPNSVVDAITIIASAYGIKSTNVLNHLVHELKNKQLMGKDRQFWDIEGCLEGGVVVVPHNKPENFQEEDNDKFKKLKNKNAADFVAELRKFNTFNQSLILHAINASVYDGQVRESEKYGDPGILPTWNSNKSDTPEKVSGWNATAVSSNPFKTITRLLLATQGTKTQHLYIEENELEEAATLLGVTSESPFTSFKDLLNAFLQQKGWIETEGIPSPAKVLEILQEKLNSKELEFKPGTINITGLVVNERSVSKVSANLSTLAILKKQYRTEEAIVGLNKDLNQIAKRSGDIQVCTLVNPTPPPALPPRPTIKEESEGSSEEFDSANDELGSSPESRHTRSDSDATISSNDSHGEKKGIAGNLDLSQISLSDGVNILAGERDEAESNITDILADVRINPLQFSTILFKNSKNQLTNKYPKILSPSKTKGPEAVEINMDALRMAPMTVKNEILESVRSDDQIDGQKSSREGLLEQLNTEESPTVISDTTPYTYTDESNGSRKSINALALKELYSSDIEKFKRITGLIPDFDDQNDLHNYIGIKEDDKKKRTNTPTNSDLTPVSPALSSTGSFYSSEKGINSSGWVRFRMSDISKLNISIKQGGYIGNTGDSSMKRISIEGLRTLFKENSVAYYKIVEKIEVKKNSDQTTPDDFQEKNSDLRAKVKEYIEQSSQNVTGQITPGSSPRSEGPSPGKLQRGWASVVREKVMTEK